MLPLDDAQVRLILLNHIAVRLGGSDSEALRAAGIENELLEHLRGLSAADLHRLATMREPMFVVTVDANKLKAGLRALALSNEAKAQETYFIRNGASWSLMRRLFKVRHKLTLQRRRELGVRRPPGRLQLPEAAMRERIGRAWAAASDLEPRARYYKLHQSFPRLSLEVLEIVVTEFEREGVGALNTSTRSKRWQQESEQKRTWHRPSPIPLPPMQLSPEKATS